MKPVDEMTQGELAAFIDTHLKENGIAVVLSGGATVAIYSDHEYVSRDIDFVDRFSLDHKKLKAVMRDLGFDRRGRYYVHPETEFFVDFVAGPPSVGRDPIREIRELDLGTGSVRIISPTDSVKDRLAAYFHFNDRQGLEQALLVAKRNDIDIEDVESWSRREGETAKYEKFLHRLNE